MLTFTNIQHIFRKQNGLSCNEYVMADMIFYLSKKDNAMGGWCYASKNTLAEEIGLTKQGVLLMLTKLENMGFVEKHPKTKYLKTTEKWNEVYYQNTNIDSKEQQQSNANKFTNGKESLPPTSKESSEIGKESLSNGKISLPNNNIDNNSYNNKDTTNTRGGKISAPSFAADFSNLNEPINNENSLVVANENLSPLNIEPNEDKKVSRGASLGTLQSPQIEQAEKATFEGAGKALQKRMNNLITNKHHKNTYLPIYEKAHAANGFQALSNEQQNTVFARFLARSFADTKDKQGNYILPTLREHREFLLKLAQVFELEIWQKKTWKAIELQAKSLVHFDSSPEFCLTLLDAPFKTNQRTGEHLQQFYYEIDKAKQAYQLFITAKQAQGDGQSANTLGNSFVRNGKVITFAETFTKPNSAEKFGIYEGVEYCLTHNGAWLVVTKEDAKLYENPQELNKVGRLRKLITEKGINV